MSWNDAGYSVYGQRTAQKLARMQKLERKLKHSIHDPSNIDSDGLGLPPEATSWTADISPYEQDQAPAELLNAHYDPKNNYAARYVASRQAISLYPKIDDVNLRIGSVIETGVVQYRQFSCMAKDGTTSKDRELMSRFELDCRSQNYPAFKIELPATDGYDTEHKTRIPLAQFREYPELLASVLSRPPEDGRYSTMRCGFIFGCFNDAVHAKRRFTLTSPRVATHALMLVLEEDLQRLGFQPSDDIVADYERGSLATAWRKYIDARFARTPIDQSMNVPHLSVIDRSIHGWCIVSICLEGLEIYKFPHIASDDNRYLPAYAPEYPNHLLREQCYYEWCTYFFPDRVQALQ